MSGLAKKAAAASSLVIEDFGRKFESGEIAAVAVLSSNEGVKGTIFFTYEGDGPTTITGEVFGLKPGLHGFHVYALGDTTNGCMSTRPHFNSTSKEHCAPKDENRHASDLGNITVGKNG